ncbi:Gfo/Idh/MocA family oxidoreductase [Mesobacillus foraminis]|uniref:Gfo/Idh/MocA family protein n=1 Tax=Mesobacillus foraminis TaxID=279826 RepID=UPI001BEBA81C|nr:Gfo/Idh/MocA family oxidoreductase [Mesobacillus foraminis]MBT2758036.1 Gfo/Idh/MocA family oxidoreductase [Mesobacillus foraminis]
MAEQILRIGMIGGGGISDVHLKAFRNNSKALIHAICDLNIQRAEEKAREYQAPHFYSDYKELLSVETIDAVVICTWNCTHAEIAIEALEAGKHVFVEKPLSKTLEEAILIEQAVQRNKKQLQVGFVRRFEPNVMVLKKFIEEGELGEIYYAKASALRRLGNPGGWFTDEAKSGGGPLIDTGIHVIDTCWYLMGRPRVTSVYGNTYRRLGKRANIKNLSFYKTADFNLDVNNVEDLANAVIKFENGASIMMDCSYTLHAKKDELSLRLYGECGGAEIEPEFLLISERHDTMLNITPQTDQSNLNLIKAFQNQNDHFVECCLNEKEPISSVWDGKEVMKIIMAIYESARLGKEVLL